MTGLYHQCGGANLRFVALLPLNPERVISTAGSRPPTKKPQKNKEAPNMKKIDIKQLRSLAIGSLVIAPALITAAYADVPCTECDSQFSSCIAAAEADADSALFQCQSGCTANDGQPDNSSCLSECFSQRIVDTVSCDIEWAVCQVDCC